MIPNLERSTAVMISGTWIVVTAAEPSSLEGWISLSLPSYIKISVRADSIEALRYVELPQQEDRVINTQWAGQ